MLKKFFILASFVLMMCSFTGTINYFEGTITYEIKYESNDPVMSTEILAKQNGDKMTYGFYGDKYVSSCNGTNKLGSIYIINTGLLTLTSTISISKAIDCSKANETLKTIEEKTSTEKILDINTKLISITAEPNNDGEEHFTTRDYYFSDDLFIQAGIFDK